MTIVLAFEIETKILWLITGAGKYRENKVRRHDNIFYSMHFDIKDGIGLLHLRLIDNQIVPAPTPPGP